MIASSAQPDHNIPIPAQPDRNGPIHCELYTVRREDQPEYEALSYAWGVAKAPQTLLLKYTSQQEHYTKVEITENLYTALEHFRKDNVHINIWTDAICINQTDAEEKSSQIKKMTDVYQSAKRTRVWLGLPTARSDAALIEFARIGNEVHQRGAVDLMMDMNHHASQFSDTFLAAVKQLQTASKT
jgi:hypothetical protein